MLTEGTDLTPLQSVIPLRLPVLRSPVGPKGRGLIPWDGHIKLSGPLDHAESMSETRECSDLQHTTLDKY
jgi:hypothetical protein